MEGKAETVRVEDEIVFNHRCRRDSLNIGQVIIAGGDDEVDRQRERDTSHIAGRRIPMDTSGACKIRRDSIRPCYRLVLSVRTFHLQVFYSVTLHSVHMQWHESKDGH